VRINVRERGETLLTPLQWEVISNDPSFASLVDMSILSAEPARRKSGWRLKAGAYVGRATLGGIDVNIVEKVPGATNALLSALAPRSFQLTQATMRESLAGRPDAMIASMLIASTRTYLSHGGEAEYREEHLTGAYVTGRLDVRRTAGLRARGVRHRVAFSRNVLDDDTPLNRSIFGALGVLATPGASSEFGVHVTAGARALRSSFGLSAKTSSMMSRSELREEAALVAGANHFRRDTSAQEAGVLASAVLEGAAFLGEAGTRLIPRSWFVNLEELFERLLRKLVSDSLGEEAKVASAAEWPGGTRPPPLFPEHSRRYASNPDLVILQKGCLTIGDAKYKDFDTWPSASDIYQLISHAAACGAERAGLFYPSEKGIVITPLGVAATGCHAWAFGIDLTNPTESIRETMRAMSLVK